MKTNKEKIAVSKKIYYDNNVEQIKEKAKQYKGLKVKCEMCEVMVGKYTITRHQQTKKCKKSCKPNIQPTNESESEDDSLQDESSDDERADHCDGDDNLSDVELKRKCHKQSKQEFWHYVRKMGLSNEDIVKEMVEISSYANDLFIKRRSSKEV
jgi:hypothetical protein